MAQPAPLIQQWLLVPRAIATAGPARGLESVCAADVPAKNVEDPVAREPGDLPLVVLLRLRLGDPARAEAVSDQQRWVEADCLGAS